MKKQSLYSFAIRLRTGFALCIAAIICALLFSFTVKEIYGDFLKPLGISKNDADEKITNSILGGYLDAYGLKNAKNIAVGNRTEVVKDLLAYTKSYVASETFKKEYKKLKESNKPELRTIQSPEEMKSEMIEQYKKSVAQTEESLKKADANMKPIFEKVLASSKEELKKVLDPGNKMFADYAKNYPVLVKQLKENYALQLNEWNSKYPDNQLLFVKVRLQQFLDETKDIDFDAELTARNGKKFFVNKAYESKGSRWKMAYRAGKEVVLPAREFVQQWISEIR